MFSNKVYSLFSLGTASQWSEKLGYTLRLNTTTAKDSVSVNGAETEPRLTVDFIQLFFKCLSKQLKDGSRYSHNLCITEDFIQT